MSAFRGRPWPRDPAREALYLRVWSVMKAEQDKREGRSATGSLFAPQFRPGRIPTRNADGLFECGHCEYEEANGALLAQCSACEYEQELADLEAAGTKKARRWASVRAAAAMGNGNG